MKMKLNLLLLLAITFTSFITNHTLTAQVSDSNPGKNKKLEKEKELSLAFARTDSLVNSRQFVFQPELYQGSYMTFVVVDSLFGEVQHGNRNNLQGRITQYEVKKNEKKKNLSVLVKMRGAMHTADVFIFVGANGKGKATVKSDIPGNFSFTGYLMNFENADIYEGPSHLVH